MGETLKTETFAQVDQAFGEAGDVEYVGGDEATAPDEAADAVWDVEGQVGGGIDGSPHAAAAHIGGG